MNAAKIMPVDLAMHVCLNRYPPVRQLLGMSAQKAHHTLTRSNAVRSSQIPASPGSSSPCGILKKKKRVVFADAKGLALTVVRIFNADPQVYDDEELSPPVKIKTEPSMQSKKLRFRLGFAQPSADAPSFVENLGKSLVHLESCGLVCRSLFGKVRVCNISPEKVVHVRITYDSWRSHQDIPCTPIPQRNGNTDTELFIFNIPVPPSANVQDRMEFCVSLRPGSGNVVFWDSNGGQNYRILVEEVKSEDAPMVQKKPLMPQNSQSSQSLPLRNASALYKSANYQSVIISENMIKTMSRQENNNPKSNLPSNANSAYR